jgi:hypothetical protein
MNSTIMKEIDERRKSSVDLKINADIINLVLSNRKNTSPGGSKVN